MLLENKLQDVASYAIDRLRGHWAMFAASLKDSYQQISDEWGRYLKNWTVDDVDRVMALLTSDSVWKATLKKYPPTLTNFLDAKRELDSRQCKLFKSPELTNYLKFLERVEYKYILIISGLINMTEEKKIQCYEILRCIHELIAYVEARATVALVCKNCTGRAILYNREERWGETGLLCFEHAPEFFREVAISSKTEN